MKTNSDLVISTPPAANTSFSTSVGPGGRGRKQTLALAGLYAALYVAVVAIFPFLSFLQLNVRVADGLRGMLRFWPWAVFLGNFVAATLANFLFSPLGFYDVALSPSVSTLTIAVAWVIGSKGAGMIDEKYSYFVGYFVHSLLLGTYLSWLLSFVLNLPFIGLWPLLITGTFVSDCVLPYVLYRALKIRLGRF